MDVRFNIHFPSLIMILLQEDERSKYSTQVLGAKFYCKNAHQSLCTLHLIKGGGIHNKAYGGSPHVGSTTNIAYCISDKIKVLVSLVSFKQKSHLCIRKELRYVRKVAHKVR